MDSKVEIEAIVEQHIKKLVEIEMKKKGLSEKVIRIMFKEEIAKEERKMFRKNGVILKKKEPVVRTERVKKSKNYKNADVKKYKWLNDEQYAEMREIEQIQKTVYKELNNE